jgi:hypothetical protein
MVLAGGARFLILNGRAHPWSHAGYGAPVAAPTRADLLTPPSTVAALQSGYRPRLHPSVAADPL